MVDPIGGFMPPVPVPTPTPRVSDHVLNPASWMHERVVRSIIRFEKRLDQDHEVGARLVSFGAETTFHIDDVSFWGPDMIMFRGIGPDGQQLELLQHYSQLSVLLVAVRKTSDKPRRIGFELGKRLESK